MNDRFSTEYIEALAHKYRHGTLTPEEEADFEAWYNSHADDLFEYSDAGHPDRAMKRMHRHIRRNTQSPTTRKLRRWLPYAAAAAVILAVGWLLLVDSRQSSVLPTGQAGDRLAAEEILPGGNRAVLTLADGRTIDLSEAQTGIIIQDGITYLDGTQVMENGELKMKNEGPGEENGILNSQLSILNSLTTPKGGTYSISLPDGSKVWLNAGSTLKYPNRFSDAERMVSLEGEAYFEIVAIDRTRATDARERSGAGSRASDTEGSRASVMRVPFKVHTSGQTVEVLGTEFNISAYPDDPETKTTLVEGRVRVAVSPLEGENDGLSGGGGVIKVLDPGQQAITRGTSVAILKVDTEPYIAWKEGLFYFDNIPSRKAIEQVARWYDLEVFYEGNTPETVVFGMIDRAKPLSAVLRSLAKSGLNFEVKSSGASRQLHVSGKK